MKSGRSSLPNVYMAEPLMRVWQSPLDCCKSATRTLRRKSCRLRLKLKMSAKPISSHAAEVLGQTTLTAALYELHDWYRSDGAHVFA